MNTNAPSRCVLLGAGGHAAVLLDALMEANQPLPDAALDSDPARWGTSFQGIPVLGGDDWLAKLASDGWTRFILGIGEVAGMALRQMLFQLGLSQQLEPVTVIHPTASLSSRAVLGRGVQLLPQSVVNAEAKLGDNVIVNSGAIVEHHCVLGAHVHVGPGAIMVGSARAESSVQIGAGATVMQGIRLGFNAVICPGAVVVNDVPDDVVVAGVPAQIIQSP